MMRTLIRIASTSRGNKFSTLKQSVYKEIIKTYVVSTHSKLLRQIDTKFK